MTLLADRYRLDRELGRGTTGTVWDAFDTVLRRRVAIKQVSFPAGMPTIEAEQLADRTLREAQAIAALSHPHVVTLFDILTPETGPVIVMELMRARSLAELIQQQGRLDDGRAAIVGLAVADGLLAAHRAGIVHRDVKPANVLISDTGQIKLTDFGIARITTDTTMTTTGMLLGSPAYIAPEVASGTPATPAADAWGLGAMLFAAVEGRPPFDRGDAIATLTSVVSDPLPSHPHAGRLAQVIGGLLVKDPQIRMPLEQARSLLAGIVAARGEMTLVPPPVDPSADADTDEDPDPDGAGAGEQRPAAEARDAPPPSAPVRTLPPPPWEGTGSDGLAPLPTVAEGPRQGRVVAAMITIGVGAAVVAFFLVRLFAALA